MSDAVLFLAGAAAFAVLGSSVVWLGARLRRPRQPDFLDQLNALAPPPRRRRVTEVDAVVPLGGMGPGGARPPAARHTPPPARSVGRASPDDEER